MTEEEAENLSEFAKLLFSDEQLATLIQMDQSKFKLQMRIPDSEIYKIVTVARLETEALIRKGIIEMAARCSTPAQAMATDLVAQMKKHNV